VRSAGPVPARWPKIKPRCRDARVTDVCVDEYTDHGTAACPPRKIGGRDRRARGRNGRHLEVLSNGLVPAARAPTSWPTANDGRAGGILRSRSMKWLRFGRHPELRRQVRERFYGPFRDVADCAPSLRPRRLSNGPATCARRCARPRRRSEGRTVMVKLAALPGRAPCGARRDHLPWPP